MYVEASTAIAVVAISTRGFAEQESSSVGQFAEICEWLKRRFVTLAGCTMTSFEAFLTVLGFFVFRPLDAFCPKSTETKAMQRQMINKNAFISYSVLPAPDRSLPITYLSITISLVLLIVCCFRLANAVRAVDHAYSPRLGLAYNTPRGARVNSRGYRILARRYPCEVPHDIGSGTGHLPGRNHIDINIFLFEFNRGDRNRNLWISRAIASDSARFGDLSMT